MYRYTIVRDGAERRGYPAQEGPLLIQDGNCYAVINISRWQNQVRNYLWDGRLGSTFAHLSESGIETVAGWTTRKNAEAIYKRVTEDDLIDIIQAYHETL